MLILQEINIKYNINMLDIEDFKKKLDKKSRLMGIDPGRKRVGIAISDENKIIATPYTTIIKNKYSDFVKEIIKVVEENQIKGIVIGNPINMDGTASQSSQSAKDLAINLNIEERSFVKLSIFFSSTEILASLLTCLILSLSIDISELC